MTQSSATHHKAYPPSPKREWAGSAWRAAVVSVLLIGALLAWSHFGQPRLQLHGTPLAGGRAPAFEGLSDLDGRPFSWAAIRGHAVLVFFGYTHCPDVCPLTMAALARSIDGLGSSRQAVRVVFVSLDPQRDTPRVLATYLHAFLPDAVGLRGSARATALAASQWGVTWRRVSMAGGNYWIDHTAAVTLVGPRGHLRARYGYGQLTDPKWLRSDLRAVLSRP